MAGRLARGLRRGLRRAAAPAVAVLAVFHGWLLAQRVAEPASLEPVVAIRWLGAAALLGGLLALRRLRVPLTGPRRAVALWACVLLLHEPGAASVEGTELPPPPVLALQAPSVASALLTLASLSLVFLLGSGGPFTPRLRYGLARPAPAWQPASRRRAFSRFSPRPPPR